MMIRASTTHLGITYTYTYTYMYRDECITHTDWRCLIKVMQMRQRLFVA